MNSIGQGVLVEANCHCGFHRSGLSVGTTAFRNGDSIQHVIAYALDGRDIVSTDLAVAKRELLVVVDRLSLGEKWICPKCAKKSLVFSIEGNWLSD